MISERNKIKRETQYSKYLSQKHLHSAIKAMLFVLHTEKYKLPMKKKNILSYFLNKSWASKLMTKKQSTSFFEFRYSNFIVCNLRVFSESLMQSPK